MGLDTATPTRNIDGQEVRDYFGPKSREKREQRNTPTVDVFLFRHSNRFAGPQEIVDPMLKGLPKNKVTIDDDKELRPEGERAAEDLGRVLGSDNYNEVIGYNTKERRTKVTEKNLAKGMAGEENYSETLNFATYAEWIKDVKDPEVKKVFQKAVRELKEELAKNFPNFHLLDKQKRGEVGESLEKKVFVKLLEHKKTVEYLAQMMAGNILKLKQSAEGKIAGGLTGRIAMPFVNHAALNEAFLLQTLRVGGQKFNSIHEIGGIFSPLEGVKISFQKDKVVCKFLNPERQAKIGQGVELTIDWAEAENLAKAFEERIKPAPKVESKKEEVKSAPVKPAEKNTHH